jgi:hypothetical protein
VRNIDEEQWSQGEHECWSINVSISVGVSINVGVVINAKGGDCWTVGLDILLSLMSTLRD